MRDPKITVIIPAYNASRYIGRALDSVLHQDYGDTEIVVVNDGSTDNLDVALRRYIGNGRIRYIATENRGVSHALNAGLDAATGDYIAFLHADDIFLPGKIKKQLSLMEGSPACGISYTDAAYFAEETGQTVKSPYCHFSGDIFYFLKRSNFIHISTTMFRRNILDNRRFDEGLTCHEDWDIFLKLSAAGVRFFYLDEVLARICMHRKNLSSNTKVMDDTRREVGGRARILWREFKRGMNIYTAEGILNLSRYLFFKSQALIMNFPNDKRFNNKTPVEMLT